MPTQKTYSKTLDTLAKQLRRKPMTAKAISEAYNCCRPVAYERIKALQSRGEPVFTLQIRESPTGPQSIAYGIK